MRKLFFLILGTLFFCFAMNSCNSSAKQDNDEQEIPMFVKADTTYVLDMVNEYMTHVQNKEYDEALSMLCEFYSEDSIFAISDEERERVTKLHKTFPVLKYTVTGMEFNAENDVTVTCAIEFFEKDPNDSIQNTIRLAFAPRRVNAEWMLTLKKH